MSPEASAPESRAARTWYVLAIAGIGALGAALVVRGKAATTATHPATLRDVPHLEGSAIAFSAAFRDRAGIGFAPVERGVMKPIVRVVGTVAFNPSYVAAVGTRLRGTVRRTFKYEGDHVNVGEALAELESAELGEAQASIVQAEASLKASETHARREHDLLEKSLTTAREAEVAETDLATTRASLKAAQQRVQALGGDGRFGVHVLRSPIAGHVVERHLSPGQSVDGAGIGYRIADLDHLWIELSVFERDLAFVHVGDDVDARPLADPEQRLPGKVAHVGEVIDERSRSTDVRITVDLPKVHLRPGQSVEATITSAAPRTDALLVPQTAVVYVDGKATVFVADGEARAHAVGVRLGASDGTRQEVLEGLEAGQRVATRGVFALKSELFR